MWSLDFDPWQSICFNKKRHMLFLMGGLSIKVFLILQEAKVTCQSLLPRMSCWLSSKEMCLLLPHKTVLLGHFLWLGVLSSCYHRRKSTCPVPHFFSIQNLHKNFTFFHFNSFSFREDKQGSLWKINNKPMI